MKPVDGLAASADCTYPLTLMVKGALCSLRPLLPRFQSCPLPPFFHFLLSTSIFPPPLPIDIEVRAQAGSSERLGCEFEGAVRPCFLLLDYEQISFSFLTPFSAISVCSLLPPGPSNRPPLFPHPQRQPAVESKSHLRLHPQRRVCLDLFTYIQDEQTYSNAPGQCGSLSICSRLSFASAAAGGGSSLAIERVVKSIEGQIERSERAVWCEDGESSSNLCAMRDDE